MEFTQQIKNNYRASYARGGGDVPSGFATFSSPIRHEFATNFGINRLNSECVKVYVMKKIVIKQGDKRWWTLLGLNQ
jgi:hypothetical protein